MGAVPKKSVFHRNKKKRFMQKMNKDRNKKIAPISPKNEVDRRQSQKLDEIHQGIKILNEMANDTLNELEEQNFMIDGIAQKMNDTISETKQQNYTMQKICH